MASRDLVSGHVPPLKFFQNYVVDTPHAPEKTKKQTKNPTSIVFLIFSHFVDLKQ